jgi:flagellar biosynthetic protein FliR
MLTIGAADLDAWLAAFVYPFFRILALFSSAPVLSHDSVPRMVRIGLAVLVTVLVAPTLAPIPGDTSPFSAPGLVLIVQQLLIGVAIGFALQIAFAAAELAGDMIGLQMGLSFATFIDPQNSDQTPIVGSFLNLLLMLLFLAMDGHLLVLAALVDTFHTFPVAVDALHWQDWHRLVVWGGQIFGYGLAIAMPVIGAMMLTNLALGVLTRTSPQLNVFSVGFPVTVIVGLLVLQLGLPWLFPALERVIMQSLVLFAR